MSAPQHTKNWPELAEGLYDRLTGRSAQIAYEFDDMHLSVPSGTGKEAEHASWVINGTVKITTRDGGSNPN